METMRIHTFQIDKSLIKAAEDTLPNSFHIGNGEANDGLKNAIFYFLETFFVDAAHHGASDKLFKQNF